jgi:hypothetical protein
MAVRIQIRRDTSANWSANNPVLYPGEIGFETDTKKFKFGPAVTAPTVATAWNSITAYANVVPSDLSNTLNDYILAADLGVADGPAKLNVDGNLLIPEDSIIFEGATANDFETTLTVTDPTADRTITLPDATGTVALAENVAALSGATFTGNISVPTQITFEGTTANDFETIISVTDPTSDRVIVFPDLTGTVVTTGDTASVTNLMLAGSIANEKLTNSAITINGTSTSLGGSRTLGTDDVSEGSTNKYFTDERAQDAIGNSVGTGLSYNDTTGAVSVDTTTIQARVTDVSDTEIGYLNGVTSAIQTQIDAKLASATAASTYAPINNPTFTGTVTLPGNPGSANEAATKSYVDNISAGLNFHAAVHAATTADLSATYDNSAKTLSASGTFPQIDTHTINETERVLVKSQTNAVQNGIYTLTDDGDPSGTWVLTRASDADNTPAGEMAYGDFTFVQNGTLNGGQGFIMTTTGTITLGTSNIVYTQFNTGQSVVAGNGLSEATPGTLSINTSITADLSTAQTLTNKTINANANTITVTSANVSDFNEAAQDAVGNAVGTGLTYTDSTGVISVTANTYDAYGSASTVAGNLSTHESDTTTHGTTGNIVGTSDTQTLTNKTLTSPKINEDVAVTATATELNYVDGVTSAIQTQLDGKVDESLFDAKGDLLVGSADNTPAKLTVGTNGYLLTANSSATNGIEWAAAPVSLPSQSGNDGKYLTTDGTTASWGTLVVPITTGTATVTANTATTVDTTALSAFTSIEYMVSLKQGSKVRTSKVVLQTDGTSVDMTEFAITETGGTLSGVVVSATTASTNAVLQVTVTDATSTNVTVKFSKVAL